MPSIFSHQKLLLLLRRDESPEPEEPAAWVEPERPAEPDQPPAPPDHQNWTTGSCSQCLDLVEVSGSNRRLMVNYFPSGSLSLVAADDGLPPVLDHEPRGPVPEFIVVSKVYLKTRQNLFQPVCVYSRWFILVTRGSRFRYQGSALEDQLDGPLKWKGFGGFLQRRSLKAKIRFCWTWQSASVAQTCLQNSLPTIPLCLRVT